MNPKHPAALRLKADARLAEGDPAAAERLLLAARLINPRDEATLARLAAAQVPGAQARSGRGRREGGRGVLHQARRLLSTNSPRCWSPASSTPRPRSATRRRASCGPTCPARRPGWACSTCNSAASRKRSCNWKRPSRPTRSTSASRTRSRCSSTWADTKRRRPPHFVIKFDPKSDKVLAAWLADYLEEVACRVRQALRLRAAGEDPRRGDGLARDVQRPGAVAAGSPRRGAGREHRPAPRDSVPRCRWPREAIQLGGRGAARTHPRLQPDPDRFPRSHLAHRGSRGARREHEALRRRHDRPPRPARRGDRVRSRHHRPRLPQLRQPAGRSARVSARFPLREYIAVHYGAESMAKLLEAFRLGLDVERRHPPCLRRRKVGAGEGLSRLPARASEGQRREPRSR